MVEMDWQYFCSRYESSDDWCLLTRYSCLDLRVELVDFQVDFFPLELVPIFQGGLFAFE